MEPGAARNPRCVRVEPPARVRLRRAGNLLSAQAHGVPLGRLAPRQAASRGGAHDDPGLDAEVLLRHVLGVDRTALFVMLPEPITAEDLAAYERLLEERFRDIPVAYLTGQREFMGMSFNVGPGVLVPRPETEHLVVWAISWLQERKREPFRVVDVGTGSGAIALALAEAMAPDWQGRIIAT